MKFTLEIDCDNIDVTTYEGVASALALVANEVNNGQSSSGGIFDRNGNLVGHYKTINAAGHRTVLDSGDYVEE